MFMHGRSRMTVDPRIPTMPGRSMSVTRQTLLGAGGGGMLFFFAAAAAAAAAAVLVSMVGVGCCCCCCFRLFLSFVLLLVRYGGAAVVDAVAVVAVVVVCHCGRCCCCCHRHLLLMVLSRRHRPCFTGAVPTLLRGAILNRTYDTHKNLPGIYFDIFTISIWFYLLHTVWSRNIIVYLLPGMHYYCIFPRKSSRGW